MSEIKPSSPLPPQPNSLWKNLAFSGWLYPLLACLFLTVAFSAKGLGTYDLGAHLAGGRWIVQNHSFPKMDPFTYTQIHRPYHDFHWLYQVLLYLVQEFLGYSALTLLHMLMILLGFGVLFWRLKLSGASPGWASLLLLAATLLMERRFVARPEVFSWFFLGLTLLVLDLRSKNRNYLFLLPLIQLFWVNTEGLFMLGWAVMAAYLISGRLHQKRWDKPLIRFSLFSLGADLVNPYFTEGITYPLTLLTRFQGENLYKQTISEFSSPWHYWQTQQIHYDWNLRILLFFLTSAALVLFILLTLRKRKFHEIFLSVLFGWLGFAMVRNIPLFALVSIPILASSLSDISFFNKRRLLPGRKLPLAMTLLIFSLALRVLTNAYYVGDRRLDRFGIGLDEDQLPVRAAGFLESHQLKGRILNNLNFGGWLDWKGSQPTFIDGRLEVMESGFFEDYLLSFQGNGLSSLLTLYQPQMVLIEYNSASSWVDQLARLPNWRLIYLDECSALYARVDYATEIASISYASLLSDRKIPLATVESALKGLKEIQPNLLNSWLEGYYRPQHYSMGLSSLGLFCLKAGEYAAARDFFLEALRRAGGGYEEIYFNLGVTFLRLNDFDLGRICLQDVLQLDPGNAPARRMLENLPY